MIVTRIMGGLGNQMFQYAVGRELSIKKNVPLALDISFFNTRYLHQGFELQRVFSCDVPQMDEAEIEKFVGWQGRPLIRRVMTRKGLSFFRSRRLAIEPHFEYWGGIKNLPDDCFLSGYWQSERYFAHVAEQIRHDFSFAQPLDEKSLAMSQLIESVNSVSLHVRRGDYINNLANASIYAVCSLAYYADAIHAVAKRIPDPHFFVFSDEPTWAEENLSIGFPVEYVSHNRGTRSYNDMRLMSLCKHNIIANSSFSWWGGWLNKNTEKMVIAPKVWFKNGIKTKDLLPENWLAL